jgi:hypothetical protein
MAGFRQLLGEQRHLKLGTARGAMLGFIENPMGVA